MPDTPLDSRPILAFDHGLRRIGVAVGNALTATASPLTTLAARDGIPDWDAIGTMLAEWQPRALLVGLPYNLDGSRQDMTDRAEKFSRRLAGRFQMPVHLVDERLSSAEAEQRLKELRQAGSRKRVAKGDIDSAAACIILESWLAKEGQDTHAAD
ncbi:MAG: Holliday junction resolvase RuvX [Gammaproteobacteria bacterium]|nr:Holliday junction resolvase RuvX [Gammaproteobacteria bacterium]